MRWLRLSTELLDDPTVQRLPAAVFTTRLMAARYGAANAFSRFLRAGFDRPHPLEWFALRRAVVARDDDTCVSCGARGGRLDCDHVLPVSRGGGHQLANLATACLRCNRATQAKTPEEWRR
jgi:hypothetical protein